MAQTPHPSVRLDDSNAHLENINVFNAYSTFYQPDEDAQIMHWLSPLEPKYKHRDMCAHRFAGVGDWLLDTSEFQEWSRGEGGVDNAVLFCSGNPGVGKTYLSSLVIDWLCDQPSKEDIAVTVFYCDFICQEEQTIPNIMGAILKQLVRRRDIPDYVRQAFQDGKKEIGGRGLPLADLMRMLKTAIASLPQVFICVDALDECQPKNLPELLRLLGDIVRESPRTRIFLTGRPYVMETIEQYFTKIVVIPISPNTDDTKNYLEIRLDRDDEPDAMDDALRADIMKIIIEKMSDTFLLVSLSIDAILEEVTVRQRRRKLNEMAQGRELSNAYMSTLYRLQAQKGARLRLGMGVLLWVSYSERPLRAEELCHALGVVVGSTDLDPNLIPSLRTLLACCLGLVTVRASSSTVHLVHPTLQEHLLNDPILCNNPHSTIAEVCLTYLNFECRWNISPAHGSVPTTMPFEEYASCYWGKHAQRGMTKNVEALALRLLNRQATQFGGQFLG